jgi:hypothetical protein
MGKEEREEEGRTQVAGMERMKWGVVLVVVIGVERNESRMKEGEQKITSPGTLTK